MLSFAAPPVPAPARAGARWWRGPASRQVWAWVRVLGGAGILGLLLWRIGTGNLLAGLRMVNVPTLLVAVGIGVLTTVLSAWRWCLVARGLGVVLPLSAATADYYRAQFLNAALPGGVLGDVHRAVRHGRDVGDLGLGVRAVALERVAGQLVVVTAAVALLLLLPTPAFIPAALVPDSPAAVGGLVALGLAVVVLAGLGLRRVIPRWGRMLAGAAATVRHGLLNRRVLPGLVISSTLVLAGYLATFLVAARAAGATAPTLQLLPLVTLALLAMAVPVNIGGWGPREGAAAWAFSAAGLGAALGLTVAVVYGLAVLVASLPGAVVLVVRWRRNRSLRTA